MIGNQLITKPLVMSLDTTLMSPHPVTRTSFYQQLRCLNCKETPISEFLTIISNSGQVKTRQTTIQWWHLEEAL